MRVMTVIKSLGPGGTERVAQNYSVGYRRAGHDVAALAIKAGGPRVENLEAEGIPVIIGGDHLDTAMQQAVEWQPDIIHVHRPGIAEELTMGVLRTLKAGAKRRCVILETNVFAKADYSADSDLIDVHLQISRWCLWKWSRRVANQRPRPIGVVVPYMVESASFQRASSGARSGFRKELGIPEEAFLFGRIGQPSMPKWSPVLISAFAKVAAKYPQAYLLLVGLPEQLCQAVDALPEPIRRRVVRLPFVHGDEALRVCYSSLDVFAHAAHIGESFGMVLAEAMLCGCPVVTLSTPHKDNSQLEVVGHGKGGLVASNEQGFVAAMINLMCKDDLRRSISAGSFEWTRSRFDVSVVMPLLLRVAEITQASSDHKMLRKCLEDDPEIVTAVRQAEIMDLLRLSTNTTPLKEKLLFHLVDHPVLYQAWSKLKHGI